MYYFLIINKVPEVLISREWSAAIYRYMVLADGTHDGGYEFEEVTADTPEEAIAQLVTKCSHK